MPLALPVITTLLPFNFVLSAGMAWSTDPVDSYRGRCGMLSHVTKSPRQSCLMQELQRSLAVLVKSRPRLGSYVSDLILFDTYIFRSTWLGTSVLLECR